MKLLSAQYCHPRFIDHVMNNEDNTNQIKFIVNSIHYDRVDLIANYCLENPSLLKTIHQYLKAIPRRHLITLIQCYCKLLEEKPHLHDPESQIMIDALKINDHWAMKRSPNPALLMKYWFYICELKDLDDIVELWRDYCKHGIIDSRLCVDEMMIINREIMCPRETIYNMRVDTTDSTAIYVMTTLIGDRHLIIRDLPEDAPLSMIAAQRFFAILAALPDEIVRDMIGTQQLTGPQYSHSLLELFWFYLGKSE